MTDRDMASAAAEAPAVIPPSADAAPIERGLPRSVFVPLLVVVVTNLVWTVFQTVQLARERETLASLQTSQAQPLQNARKLRESLDRLARDTQALATKGNTNATLVVDELRKRGVTIDPNAPSGNITLPTAPAK